MTNLTSTVSRVTSSYLAGSLSIRTATGLLLLLIAGCATLERAPSAPWPEHVREYLLPRADAFPNDIAVDQDGAVWYVDRFHTRVGRLDPESGAVREYPLEVGSALYSVAVAPDGAIWYAASGTRRLGRLDPVTGEVRELTVPGGEKGGPHLLHFSGNYLWFTLRRTNQYGRLATEAGEIHLHPFTPDPVGSRFDDRGPYDLAVAPDATPWFTAMRHRAIFQVDPVTGETTRFPLPEESGAARRLTIGADGAVWFTDFEKDHLGRLDPATGEVRLVPLLRRPARPYAITSGPDGRIWFNESANDLITIYAPNERVRRSIAIPTPGAVVRGMAVDSARGRVWFGLSGTGRIGRVDVW